MPTICKAEAIFPSHYARSHHVTTVEEGTDHRACNALVCALDHGPETVLERFRAQLEAAKATTARWALRRCAGRSGKLNLVVKFGQRLTSLIIAVEMNAVAGKRVRLNEYRGLRGTFPSMVKK
jgi:hypothetical protein